MVVVGQTTVNRFLTSEKVIITLFTVSTAINESMSMLQHKTPQDSIEANLQYRVNHHSFIKPLLLSSNVSI